MSANLWNPGSLPLKDAQNTISYQYFTPPAGTETLLLTDFAYVLGAGSILAFRNGEIMTPVIDYQEVTPTSIDLTLQAQEGDDFLLIGFIRVYDATEQVVDIYELLSAVYLGYKVSDPLVDNLGNPLIAGAWYYQIGVGPRIYNGTNWLPMGIVQTDIPELYSTQIVFTGQRSKQVIAANAAATVGCKILANVSGITGQYRQDELEFEAFSIPAICRVNGQVQLNVQSLWGRLRGTYTISYAIQA